MKKVLKSFKRALMLEEEEEGEKEKDKKNQCPVKPEAESSSKPEEPSQTRAVVTNVCEKGMEAEKLKETLVTTGCQEKVQTDQAKSSFQTAAPPFRREVKNGNDCRLFLGGFPENITAVEVREVFEKYGKVVDIVIPFDKESNKFQKYGYLEFATKDSAQACLDVHFVTIRGKKVEVKKAWPHSNLKKVENRNKKETKEIEKLPPRPKVLETAEPFTDSPLGSPSTSTGYESNVEDSQLLYQELFNNYFKTKFFLQNLLGVEEASNVPLSKKINKQQEISEAEMKKILMGLTNNILESSVGDDSDDFSDDFDETNSTADELESDFTETEETTLPDQTENFLFPVRGEKGRVCEICKWAPIDNSTEGFLAHCKTAAHKQRLKERFKKNNNTSDKMENETVTKVNPRNCHQMNKRSSNPQITKQKRKKPVPCRKGQGNENGKSVLEELFLVEAKTERCLKCKLCNKKISQASDIRVIISNLSSHLQSKGHLARSLEKPQTKPEVQEKSQKSVKNPQTHRRNLTEATKQKWESCRNAECAEKNRAVPPGKGKSMPQLNKSTANFRFRCLACNYFCCKTNTLVAHLNSESHLGNSKETSSGEVSPESVWDVLKNCSKCGTFLYGCSHSVRSHIFKCKASDPLHC